MIRVPLKLPHSIKHFENDAVRAKLHHMAHRTYRRRKPQRPWYSSSYRSEPPPIDVVFDAILDGLVLLARWIARTALQIWRKLIPPKPARTAAVQLQPNTRPTRMPYQKADGLLTKGERALWHPLRLALKDKYCLFCKVRLADVVRCAADNRNEQHWFKLIGHFHVDFVLCDPQTTAPLLVIELDDRTHQHERQSRRDRYKDDALHAAGMPICRIPAQIAYDPIDLAQTIDRLLNPQPIVPHTAPPSQVR